MTSVLSPLVWWIRLWQTQRERVGAVEKVFRAAMIVPAFGILLIILRSRLWLRGPIVVTANTIDDTIFRCHPPDLIQMYLWLFRVWEPDLTQFIRTRLRSGDNFIDVGANIGYYSVLAAKSGAKRVVAIEASPAIYRELMQSLALNDLGGKVRAINMAAAAQAGEITVYSGPAHNIGLTSTVAREGMAAQSTIRALPLDDLLTSDESGNARLIKIDVEGAEPQVLAGMKQILAGGRPELEIILELSPHWWNDRTQSALEVLKPFIDAGFQIYQMQNIYWPWRYLWPNCVKPLRRVNVDELSSRASRFDLVLSRANYG